jgi:hypothetical protein
MLLLSKADKDANARQLAATLMPRVAGLLDEAAVMREDSLYPGRSLDLELAISVPHGWLRPITSVTTILRTRATDANATLRERGTAAHGLWERAIIAGLAEDEDQQAMMRDLIEHFHDAEQVRPDIASGLRWVATTLDYVVRNRILVCNDWDVVKVDEPWFAAIEDTAKLLAQEDIPVRVRSGTKRLFEHVLLQNSGVERRKAIDAISAGGYVEPVARALGRVLRDPRIESWMRIRAIFALGFMQHRSTTTARSLTSACRQACEVVRTTDEPTRSQINELHSVLFAIGDCYGAIGAEEDAKIVRDGLRSQLEHLVEDTRIGQKRMYPIARALVYMLTFTAQPRGRSDPNDLSQMLLEALQHHHDTVTADFSQWALGFRFSDSGDIHPILHAAG